MALPSLAKQLLPGAPESGTVLLARNEIRKTARTNYQGDDVSVYSGGLQKVTITRLDDHTASIKLGEDKLLDIEYNSDRKVAVHKRKKEKPVAVDAQELLNALGALLAG